MLHFQARPDRVFLAIVDEALQHSREELDFTPTYTPTREDPEAMYEISDYHWLVLHECLEVFCDLHNDAALDDDGHVGPYTIDAIDFAAIVDRFFWDIDFQLGPVLLDAEERAPGRIQASRQAWMIAAGLRPDPEDLRIVPVERSDEEIWSPDPDEHLVPESGYVGPYPLLEPDSAR